MFMNKFSQTQHQMEQQFPAIEVYYFKGSFTISLVMSMQFLILRCKLIPNETNLQPKSGLDV